MNSDPAQLLTLRADPGTFSDSEIAGIDEPVRRYFNAAITTGTPLARAARLRIHGSIKLGNQWLPFRSTEQLAPLHGYHWPATIAWGILRGSDTYVNNQTEMLWKVLGLLPVVRASGADAARSAMGRAVTEGIWLPTALLPRYGVDWHAVTDEQIVADAPIGTERVRLQITIDEDGHVSSDHLDRWNDTDGTGTFTWTPFGVDVTGTAHFDCGLSIPAQGVGGWYHATERWPDGQFMRYTISQVTLI